MIDIVGAIYFPLLLVSVESPLDCPSCSLLLVKPPPAGVWKEPPGSPVPLCPFLVKPLLLLVEGRIHTGGGRHIDMWSSSHPGE